MLKPGDIVRLKPEKGWAHGLIAQYADGPFRVRGAGNHFGVFLETMDGTIITWENGSGPHQEVNFHEFDLEWDRFMTAVAQRKSNLANKEAKGAMNMPDLDLFSPEGCQEMVEVIAKLEAAVAASLPILSGVAINSRTSYSHGALRLAIQSWERFQAMNQRYLGVEVPLPGGWELASQTLQLTRKYSVYVISIGEFTTEQGWGAYAHPKVELKTAGDSDIHPKYKKYKYRVALHGIYDSHGLATLERTSLMASGIPAFVSSIEGTPGREAIQKLEAGTFWKEWEERGEDQPAATPLKAGDLESGRYGDV